MVFLFFILFLSTPPPSYSSNNHTDFEALISFKKSIREDPLQSLASWNQTTPHDFCTWKGVSCSKRHPNRVVSVILGSQGLVGSLPPHIGNLSFLTTLILQNNTFHGPIPEQIGRLRRLRMLELSNNSFHGVIPANFSQCRVLNYLNLIDNQLTGTIAPGLLSLVQLKNLGLGTNMLSGTIPPSIGNLTNLVQLSISKCGLHGEIPESLVRLGRMRWLFMSDNSLSGTIPLGFYNLSSIEAVELGYNRLHGTIPSFTFPKLRNLGLGFNRFTGQLPPSLSNSSLVQRLHVSFNNFTADMIDLSRLASLELLLASGNHFKGDVHVLLSSLTNSTALRVLSLDDNLFTGSMPASLGNLSTHLFRIKISQNQLSGSIPSSIGDLVGLSVIIAADNNLEGPIPSSIGNLHRLQEIYLYSNRLTDEMPSSLGNLSLLNYVILSQNNLSGRIPQSLGNCSKLFGLDLSENNLNGSIPWEVMSLSSLSIGLDLSYNLLIGTIPPQVGNLRNTGILDLSHNRLSGSIPTSLSSCVMMELLQLGSNSLQGEIPDVLSALRGLQYLDLSDNNFSGKIPDFLAELNLLSLNISFNALQGQVPSIGVFQNQSAISLQGNHDLCGGAAFLSLPSCPSTNSKTKLDLRKILIPTLAGAICLALALCVCFCVFMYRRRRTLQGVGTPGGMLVVPELLRLSYAELLNATGGFVESNLLGAGRFGSVYKGTIVNYGDDDGEERVVAVKVLDLNVRGAYKSLASECNALRGIRHRNLLKIVSVCDSIDFQGNDFKALVYEFIANGSLENWLHRNSDEEQGSREQGSRVHLSFLQRLNIAIDVASAVEYLHCGSDSSNILLDRDMVAHVGDFGLAKIISSSSGGRSSSTAAIKGTIGYIAPEYGMNDVVSTQGDAYSYGILVLEMFTNTRPTSTDAFQGHTNLQDFISSALPGRVTEVVDPLLHQQLNQDDSKYWDCIISILRIGVRCSMEFPRDRMSMAEAVNDLKNIRNIFLADRKGRNVAPYQH